MTWPNKITIEFLNLYEQEPVIWDPEHIHYKNRVEVNEAWERIKDSFSVDCSVMELKKKKESLMATFRLIINKLKSNGSDNSFTSSWFAFDKMLSFLGDIYRLKSNRRTENSIGSVCYSDESKEEIGDDEVDNIFVETESQKCTKNVLLDNHDDTVYPLEIKEEMMPPIETKEENGKRKALDSFECSSETPSKLKVNRSVYNQSETDECTQYLELLETKLRSFNKRDRILLMHEIDHLIFKARMQGFQS